MNIVSLYHTKDTIESVRRSIFKVLEHQQLIMPDVKSVIIKPNLCYYWDTTTGQTTDPRVVMGLIDWIRERYGMNTQITIAEADASAMRTDHAFKFLGYEELARTTKVDLFNLSNDEVIKKQVFVNDQTMTFAVPKSLFEADLFINVPKLKVTVIEDVYITCALKNIFGCIATPRKVRYHKFLNEAIVGINSILHPHLTVVDGIYALGNSPIKLGLIMASNSAFSIDWIASRIMGYNPNKIQFLKLAIKQNLGNPKDISLSGADYNTFRNIFPTKNMRFAKLTTTLLLKMLGLYTTLSGDITNPVLD